MPAHFEFDDEATAVVNLTDLRAARKAQSKYHLLVHVQGTQRGRVHVLPLTGLLMGRSGEADVWIGDDGVSRKHARFVAEDGGFVVEDLNSANGTFVQGIRTERHRLQDGDQIQLGPSAMFRYSIEDEDQKNLLEQLYSTSVTDSLTGARNREYLDSLLVSELSFARRHDQALSFVLFDLDHFKQVNDNFGHPAGDAVLREVAQAVRSAVRAEDSLCRYGGEEFAIVLRNVDKLGAHATGERIRAIIAGLTIRHDQLELRVTASVGCASASEIEDATPVALIDLADKRLYVAKKGGRNRVVSQGSMAQRMPGTD